MKPVIFEYKDKKYTITPRIQEAVYSLSNCGMLGLSTPVLSMYIQDDQNMYIHGTYRGLEIERAWKATIDVDELIGLLIVEKYKVGYAGKQILINDNINSNKGTATNRLMLWLIENAEKHGGTVWQGPVSSNPNYGKYQHLIQSIIWIPHGDTVKVAKSMKTGNWMIRPTQEQEKNGCQRGKAYVS